MAAYANVADVQKYMMHQMTEREQEICAQYLESAAVMIDCVAPGADSDAKNVVSCRMVLRVMPTDDSGSQIPVGATQGSMSALGYSQSWTFGSNGGTGELYIGKADRQILGLGNKIGSYSPVQELAWGAAP